MKRALCPACERPEKVCLCQWLQQINNKFPITVLRHKSEAGHALNTVNILKKSLRRILVVDGEIFDENIIPENSFLIYPSEDAAPLENVNIPESAQLILLDGSWKKTRKILYLNPWLLKLPKISLPLQNSRYYLRKQKDRGFSTLEAVYTALSELDKQQNYKALLTCLDKMMEQQAHFIEPEILKDHFGERVAKISSDKNGNKAANLFGHNNPDDKLPRQRTHRLQSQQ